MSRFIVRRLTAAVVLAAVLCAAAPALAAPGSGPVSPVVPGSGLLDQFLAWVGSLWAGREGQGWAPIEKARGGSGGIDTDPDCTVEADRAGAFDPNG